jgi:hypothetical protein
MDRVEFVNLAAKFRGSKFKRSESFQILRGQSNFVFIFNKLNDSDPNGRVQRRAICSAPH